VAPFRNILCGHIEASSAQISKSNRRSSKLPSKNVTISIILFLLLSQGNRFNGDLVEIPKQRSNRDRGPYELRSSRQLYEFDLLDEDTKKQMFLRPLDTRLSWKALLCCPFTPKSVIHNLFINFLISTLFMLRF